MAELELTGIWDRVRQGQSSIVQGAPLPLQLPDDIKVLRINCALPWTSEGPLHQAYQQIQSWLGETTAAREAPPEKGKQLRYQLLGEMPLYLVERGFSGACERLANATDGKAALLFEAAEQATPSVLGSLRHLLLADNALSVPWILVYHGEATGEGKQFLHALTDRYGDELLHTPQQEGPSFETSSAFAWETLSPPALRVLRAAAVIGSVFEAELLARLLASSHQEVLETLQEAVDQGAPLGDYGNSRFFLPQTAVHELTDKLLPSLKACWHEKLAGLLRQPEEAQSSPPLFSAETAELPLIAPEPQTEIDTPATETTAAKEAKLSEEVDQASQTKPPLPAEVYAALFASADGAESSDILDHPQQDIPAPTRELGAVHKEKKEDGDPATNAPIVVPPMALRHAPTRPSKGKKNKHDSLRAAQHLRAGGKQQEALESFLSAAQQASSRGDTLAGMQAIQEALDVITTMPRTTHRAIQEAHTLAEMARLKWHGATAGQTYTLQDALDTLLQAQHALPAVSPLPIRAQIAALFAGMAHDIGELGLITEAQRELAEVSRQLLSAEEPTLAARLLNDQAALYIRLGDPLQASQLLYHSRELFQGLLQEHPEQSQLAVELADTEHMLARLPLHARIRPSREYEALTMALGHARSAAKIYEALQTPRALGNTLTTIGKLELGREQDREAEAYFFRAVRLQQQTGDWTGLARTSAALADLFLTRGKYPQALQCIRESAILNMEKGAPIGIAFNRRDFAQLRTQLAKHSELPLSLHRQMTEVEQLLAHAERVLGAIPLPKHRHEGLLHS
jgi:tetratricopeptide (TPR) repeat protein